MLKEILFVGVGSFIGGALRYVISKLFNTNVSWGIMLINVVGCLLIGIFYALFEKGGVASPEARLFLAVGLCGGFTTFSGFASQSVFMLRDGQLLTFALYMAGSILLGLAAVWLGYWLVRAV